jgi:hypothetical protein
MWQSGFDPLWILLLCLLGLLYAWRRTKANTGDYLLLLGILRATAREHNVQIVHTNMLGEKEEAAKTLGTWALEFSGKIPKDRCVFARGQVNDVQTGEPLELGITY